MTAKLRKQPKQARGRKRAASRPSGGKKTLAKATSGRPTARVRTRTTTTGTSRRGRTSTAASAGAEPTLRRGSRGDAVVRLQGLLNTRVPRSKLPDRKKLVEDGIFGSKTEAAVITFQQQENLLVDGIVGPQTWGALGVRATEPRTPTRDLLDEPYTGPAGLIRRNGEAVPYYAQFDPRWKSRRLGDSSSISAAGCAVTSLAMVLAYYGRNVDPGKLDAFLDQNKGYDGNSVYWQRALDYRPTGTGPGLRYVEKRDGSAATLIPEIDRRLDRGQPTIAKVKYPGSNSHFVVIVGRNSAGEHLINDPGVSAGNASTNPDRKDAVLERASRGYTLVRIEIIVEA